MVILSAHSSLFLAVLPTTSQSYKAQIRMPESSSLKHTVAYISIVTPLCLTKEIHFLFSCIDFHSSFCTIICIIYWSMYLWILVRFQYELKSIQLFYWFEGGDSSFVTDTPPWYMVGLQTSTHSIQLNPFVFILVYIWAIYWEVLTWRGQMLVLQRACAYSHYICEGCAWKCI